MSPEDIFALSLIQMAAQQPAPKLLPNFAHPNYTFQAPLHRMELEVKTLPLWHIAMVRLNSTCIFMTDGEHWFLNPQISAPVGMEPSMAIYLSKEFMLIALIIKPMTMLNCKSIPK